MKIYAVIVTAAFAGMFLFDLALRRLARERVEKWQAHLQELDADIVRVLSGTEDNNAAVDEINKLHDLSLHGEIRLRAWTNFRDAWPWQRLADSPTQDFDAWIDKWATR